MDFIFTSFCQDGVFVKGLFLEGAGWDKKNSCLVEADPMQLVCLLPTIHFKPVENKKKTGKGEYELRSKRRPTPGRNVADKGTSGENETVWFVFEGNIKRFKAAY